MGLFSNLLDTYEKCCHGIGIVQMQANGEADERKTFLPIFHTTFKSQVCVTIDQFGNFINIVRDSKDQTIIIPCSEKSASRSSGIAAHPLCDQLSYIDNKLDTAKFTAYIKELNKWKGENKKLNALHTFLTNNSVVEAIKNADLFKENEKDIDGNPLSEKIVKIGVRFSVQISGDNFPNVWEDKDIRDAWIFTQTSKGNCSGDINFDYLSGSDLTMLAQTHPKNINSSTGNAKLLSCNDQVGFTYRGRFTSQDEAIQVDALSSQKAHQTLKWLINNHGYRTDTQVIVIWAVDDSTDAPIKPFGSSFDINEELFSDMQSIKSESEILHDIQADIDINYAQKLVSALKGYSNAEVIKQHSKKIVIAIFDAATTGRMGVVFYQEFPQNVYLENIADWHQDSAWKLSGFKKKINSAGKEESVFHTYTGCPSFNDVLTAVHGKPRSSKDAGYTSLKKKMQKQLLECMFGNFAFPKSFVDAAAVRASHPLSFTDDKNSFMEYNWRNTLDIACSLARKYYKQQKKEDILMELEELRSDRDYLYGRLLAVANKLEQQVYYDTDKKGQRATNAIRLMSSFAVKPYYTWGVLWNQLLPYINQLQGDNYYLSLFNDILYLFKEGEYEDNKPLSPLYIMGFSAQTRKLYQKKES